MSKFAILAAAAVLISTSAFAQNIGKQTDVIEPNTKASTEVPTSFAPNTPAPAVAATVPQCTLVTLKLPVIDTKQKPVSYQPTIRDSQEGLSDDLKACNQNSEIVAHSSKTARIKVTQGADGVAYLKLPSDRLARILITFHISVADWNKERAWGVTGPVGQRTDLVMQPQDEKTFPKTSTN